ncbi:MAG: polyketide antibiotic transporter, partial [Nevskiales bacterium]
GANKAARLFYGTPHNLETVAGYSSWRVGGLLAVAAAFFGLWVAVSVFRSEEETGRAEVVAAGAITRRLSFAVRLLAVGAMLTVLWLATLIGLVAAGLPIAGSAYLALATVAPAAIYGGVGSVASQLSPTGRGAMGIAGAALGFDFAVRVISDTADLQWLHWALPLGWMEELRPFADPRPAVLLLPLAVMAAFVALAFALNGLRDVGSGLLAANDVQEQPHRRLLASPTLLALRSAQISLAVWTAAVGAFAILVGAISKSVALGISSDLGEQMRKIGGVDLTKPSGYIGLTFLFFVLAVAMFCCSQLAAIREEEAEGRLETLFALPESRTGWLAGRLGLAAAGATMLALAAGFGTALGAIVIGAEVSVPQLIAGGLNCLP